MTIASVLRKRRARARRCLGCCFAAAICFSTLGLVRPAYAIDCPERVLTDAEVREFVELARRVDRERRANGEVPTLADPVLPPASSSKFETRVGRIRCMYIYSEIAVPKDSGANQEFSVDPYGDVFMVFPVKAMKALQQTR
jgi:hypothetical protein